jgi:peptide/nickel transport system ATP-binding protein
VLFITHDLSLGNYISERTMIMRRGVVVEMGRTDKVLGNPQHPYSRTLVAAVPRLDCCWRDIKGRVPEDGPSEPCPVHTGGVVDGSGLVEVEPDHFVGCHALAGCIAAPTPAAVTA